MYFLILIGEYRVDLIVNNEIMDTYKGPLDFTETPKITLFNKRYTYNNTKINSTYDVTIKIQSNNSKLSDTEINTQVSL